MNAAAGTPLDGERYLSVETFRRDGTGVRTPVWAAGLGGRLVIVTGGDSYKVRRLRRDPRVRVAACDARGAVRGPWHEGRARFVEDAAARVRAHGALVAKYGWQVRVLDLFSWLGRRISRRVYLEIALDAPSAAGTVR